MTTGKVLRVAAELMKVAAQVADGIIPSPDAVARLLYDAACVFGCETHLSDLIKHLTPEAIERERQRRKEHDRE